MNPEQLIAAGPAKPEEVAAKAASIAAQIPEPSHQVNENTSTKSVLSAFEAVKNKDGNPDETHIKKLLEEEEKSADNSEGDGEEVSKGDEGIKPPVQETKEIVPDKAKSEEVPATPKLGTVPKSPSLNYVEELKALGIPETAQGLFKQMANPAKEFVIAELKRRGKEVEEFKAKVSELEASKQEVKDGLPQGWYEHEEAYTITPEFKQLSQTFKQVSSIEEHYRQQLIAIKEGEDWDNLVVNKDGSIGQVKLKASPQADAFVMGKIQEAYTTRRELENKEVQMAQAFKQNAYNHKAGIQKLEDDYFPQYADRKAFEANKDVKDLQAIFKAQGLHNDRLSGVTTRMYAFLMEKIRKVEELEKQVASIKPSREVPKNGPTGDEINAGTSAITKQLPVEERPYMGSKFAEYHK